MKSTVPRYIKFIFLGWLEPLLTAIAENKTRVVSPVIDIINDNSFSYTRSFELHWGAFNWALHFRWFALTGDVAREHRRASVEPFKTPVMAGGLFSMDRNYFFALGSYDAQMKIWGGENLELSFRVWQCGGSVEITPCSHVGHLFRKSSPYTFPGGVGDILYGNLARVALVWMDEWAEFYFKFNPGLFNFILYIVESLRRIPVFDNNVLWDYSFVRIILKFYINKRGQNYF